MKDNSPKQFKQTAGQVDEAPRNEAVVITPGMSEQIKQQLIAAIAKSYRPCPLIGPKWFLTPQTGHAGFTFVGADKLAKAVKRSSQEVCKTIMANFDVAKFPATLVLKNGPAIQVVPKQTKA